MTIGKALAQVDELIPNIIDEETKRGWLGVLDGRIVREIFSKYRAPGERDDVSVVTYDADTSLDTKLLAEPPYDDMYIFWLESRIYYYLNEYTKHNNALSMFRSVYDDYRKWIAQNNMPGGVSKLKYI